MAKKQTKITTPTVSPAEKRYRRKVNARILEEHLTDLEGALLIIAHGIKRQREMLDRMKELEGWDWEPLGRSNGMFGDAVLFHKYDVKLVEREPAS
jgi:hypothetical protein